MYLFLRFSLIFNLLTFDLYATSLSDNKNELSDQNLSKPFTNISNAELTTHLYDLSLKLTDELEKTFQTLLKKHNSDQVFQSKIISSQTHWKKYMEAELEMIFPHMDESKYNWSGAGQCYYKYKNILIKDRIVWLNNFEKRLEIDGCISWN